MKAKLLFLTSLLAAALIGGGCTNNVSNLTPENLPQNSSGIYTITVKGKIAESNVVAGSQKCTITIDGTAREMTRSAFSKDMWTYDYIIPEGQDQARYFYVIEYDVKNRGIVTHRERKSPLQRLFLANRYVVSIEADRGVVGAKVSVTGRGFTRMDKIVVGGTAAPTQFISPQVLVFTVPAVQANQDYYVELQTTTGNLAIGKFRVDPSVLRVTPAELELVQGKRSMIVFASEFDAPDGGLPIEILTNVPDSVVMPPVVIPEGKRSISVRVEGGQPGSGQIVISAPGFNPLTIPVNVTAQ